MADLFRYIRSAILKTSQPRPAKLKPQKSVTVTIALTLCFLHDDYELYRANASNKMLKANPRLKFIVLLSPRVVDPRPAARRDAAHTPLTMRKPSSVGLDVRVRRAGIALSARGKARAAK